MVRFFCRIMMTLCCTILLAASVQAKTLKEVYLKDGGIIKCQNAWQANGKVMVLVNRDILLDLSKTDVDLKKTFARKPAKSAKKAKLGEKVASGTGAVMAQGVAQPEAKPVVAQAEGQKPEATPNPAAKTAPPAAKQPAAEGVKPAPPGTKQPSPEGVKPAPPEPAQQAAPAPAPEPAPPATEAPPVRENLPVAQPPVLPERMPSALSPGIGSANGIIMLLLAIVMIVSLCKVFEKAGEAWWKAIIPIYNFFVLVSIAGKPMWWGFLMLIPIVNIPVVFIIHIALARRFGQGVAFGLGLVLVGFVFFPLLAFGKYEYS
jgi:hypothetical protein